MFSKSLVAFVLLLTLTSSVNADGALFAPGADGLQLRDDVCTVPRCCIHCPNTHSLAQAPLAVRVPFDAPSLPRAEHKDKSDAHKKKEGKKDDKKKDIGTRAEEDHKKDKKKGGKKDDKKKDVHARAEDLAARASHKGDEKKDKKKGDKKDDKKDVHARAEDLAARAPHKGDKKKDKKKGDKKKAPKRNCKCCFILPVVSY